MPSFTGYTLEFRHAMRRRRDDDNLAASCKAYRDGIADALGIDDFRLRLLAPPSQHIDRAQPCLRVTLHVWPFPCSGGLLPSLDDHTPIDNHRRSYTHATIDELYL